MPVTIRDVAKHVSLSPKTISRVLNDEPTVRPETRTRVLAAMQRLGYVPNVSAQRLARGQSKIIALVFPKDTGHFLNTLVHSMLVAGHEAGYEVLLHLCDPERPADRRSIAQLAARGQADGLILIPPCERDEELIQQLRQTQCRFVRLFADDNSALPTVCVDNRRTAREITVHLLSLGHERIGFIAGPETHRSSTDRLAGFKDGLATCGLSSTDELLRPGNFLFEDGVSLGQELLALAPRPTAILASNDDMAAGVLMAAHQQGIRVPEELSIAGFDDVELARQVWPPLTTVRHPTAEIATVAIDMLVRLLQNKPVTTHHHVSPSQLVVRQSTAPPPVPPVPPI